MLINQSRCLPQTYFTQQRNHVFFSSLQSHNMIFSRLASLVDITEGETEVGKLGWHGNSTGFDRENAFFLFCVTKEERKIS